jgi:hypothetical protein
VPLLTLRTHAIAASATWTANNDNSKIKIFKNLDSNYVCCHGSICNLDLVALNSDNDDNNNNNKTSTAITYAAASATWIWWHTKKKTRQQLRILPRQHLQPGFGGALDGVPPH